MSSPHILHVFSSYLTTTENWLYRLITHLPDAQISIASKRFLPCEFYAPNLLYLEFPLFRTVNPGTTSPQLQSKMTRALLRSYPYYLQNLNGKNGRAPFDLIHSHFSNVGWEYRGLARRLKIPHVISFYGYDYEQLPHLFPLWRKRYEILFRDADMFLCEGNHGAQTLEKLGCPSEKIRVVRLGVETAKIPFEPRTKKPGELRLLQIASLTQKKGHIYTVKAFVEALRDCPHMTLTIIGADKAGILPLLKQSIQGTPAEDKVNFQNHLDFSQLYEFMKAFDVFIHPSCYADDMDCEGGAPVVLLDAQAAGMPVISTKHCDIPDSVLDGKTGVLCAEKDVTGLAAAIRQFYEMPAPEFVQFSAAARAHVETNYEVSRNAALAREIYGGLISR